MVILKLIGRSLLCLSLLAGLILLLLPLGILQRAGMFTREPESALWLFFVLGLTAGLILSALGARERSVGRLSKIAGSILLLLGLASAVVIFLIKANLIREMGILEIRFTGIYIKDVGTTSLWWLFVICNILGGIAVYLAAPRAAKETPQDTRSINVFFYGLFMDEALLLGKGTKPLNGRIGSVKDFSLAIGARATLVPSPGQTVYGVLFSLTHAEVDALYSEDSVSAYRPEAVTVHLEGESVAPALCFNLPAKPTISERNPQYVSKLREVAKKVGLPEDYVGSIQ
jgi:hypothetical protein